MLFGGAPLRFGTNPLQQFRRDLLAGRYTPEKHAMRALVAQARRRDSELLAAEQQVRTLQRVLEARKRLLEAAAAKTQITLPVAVQKMDTKKFQVYCTCGASLTVELTSDVGLKILCIRFLILNFSMIL
jgi:hypothetical protein